MLIYGKSKCEEKKSEQREEIKGQKEEERKQEMKAYNEKEEEGECEDLRQQRKKGGDAGIESDSQLTHSHI